MAKVDVSVGGRVTPGYYAEAQDGYEEGVHSGFAAGFPKDSDIFHIPLCPTGFRCVGAHVFVALVLLTSGFYGR